MVAIAARAVIVDLGAAAPVVDAVDAAAVVDAARVDLDDSYRVVRKPDRRRSGFCLAE